MPGKYQYYRILGVHRREYGPSATRMLTRIVSLVFHECVKEAFKGNVVKLAPLAEIRMVDYNKFGNELHYPVIPLYKGHRYSDFGLDIQIPVVTIVKSSFPLIVPKNYREEMLGYLKEVDPSTPTHYYKMSDIIRRVVKRDFPLFDNKRLMSFVIGIFRIIRSLVKAKCGISIKVDRPSTYYINTFCLEKDYSDLAKIGVRGFWFVNRMFLTNKLKGKFYIPLLEYQWKKGWEKGVLEYNLVGKKGIMLHRFKQSALFYGDRVYEVNMDFTGKPVIEYPLKGYNRDYFTSFEPIPMNKLKYVSYSLKYEKKRIKRIQ